jgi:hypothetical protein
MARAAACGTIDRNLQKPAPAGCPPRRLAPRQRIDVLLARPPGLAYRAFVCAGPRNCGCGPASPGRQRKPDGARRYVARRPRETATYSRARCRAVAWKRAQLRAESHRYTDVKPERIERAIADDVAFLEAHPTRRSIAASRQSSKPGRR